MIWPNGQINGLDLDADGLLVVRDMLRSLRRQPHPHHGRPALAMGPGGTLRMVFEEDCRGIRRSPSPRHPGHARRHAGTHFADDVNLASQVGRTFDLFDWTGVSPTGAFAISSPYTWDLSNLYTTGEVTLTAIPEPGTLLLTCSTRLRSFPLWPVQLHFV